MVPNPNYFRWSPPLGWTRSFVAMLREYLICKDIIPMDTKLRPPIGTRWRLCSRPLHLIHQLSLCEEAPMWGLTHIWRRLHAWFLFKIGVELVPRFVGPTSPVGVRVYQPRRQDLVESTRHRGFPAHLRVLPEDGVAMLDIANYGHRVDHHRDMRLDIDHMSYEELLALGEQIGNAGSSLSDDFILGHLKTKFLPLLIQKMGLLLIKNLISAQFSRWSMMIKKRSGCWIAATSTMWTASRSG